MDKRVEKGCTSGDSCQLFIGLLINFNAHGWIWPDDTPYDDASYKNWAGGEPNNFSGYDGCVEMKDDGSWNDVFCAVLRMWMCEKDATARTEPTTTPTSTTPLVCEDGWSPHRDSCYFLGIGISAFSKSNCEGRGAQPVSIDDAAENAFVHREFFSPSFYGGRKLRISFEQFKQDKVATKTIFETLKSENRRPQIKRICNILRIKIF